MFTNTKVVKFSQAVLPEAAKCVAKGGIVIIPTENVYGFIFSGKYPQTLNNVYDLKKRPREKAFVVSTTKESIEQYAFVSDSVKQIINSCWPSSLVFVLDKKKTVPDYITGGLKNAAFVSLKSPIADYIVRHVDGPVCGTTCNISGEREITKCTDALKLFNNKVELVIDDDSMLEHNTHSTIITFSENPPRVLRQGAFSPEIIKEKYAPDLIVLNQTKSEKER